MTAPGLRYAREGFAQALNTVRHEPHGLSLVGRVLWPDSRLAVLAHRSWPVLLRYRT